MNARVKKPRLLKNNARKPVNSACLNENSRMNPQATVGILRSTVANARMTICTGPPTPETREATTARTNAIIAASVPAAMASRMVMASAAEILPI